MQVISIMEGGSMATKKKAKSAGKVKPTKKPVKAGVSKKAGKPVKKTVKKTVKKIAPKKKIAAKKKPQVKIAVKKPVVTQVAPGAPGADKKSCEVVEMGGNSFVLVVNRARNFFDLQEMRTIVRLCHEARNEGEAAVRMFGWFQGRRKDVLIDSDIRNAADAALVTIYRYLISHYAVKQ
jgi:hypothetical protein